MLLQILYKLRERERELLDRFRDALAICKATRVDDIQARKLIAGYE